MHEYGMRHGSVGQTAKTAVMWSLVFLIVVSQTCVTCRTFPFHSARGFGTSRKAEWIENALIVLRSGKYPRLKIVSYWHENWENKEGPSSLLRIDSSDDALAAYREGIDDPVFTTTPVWKQTDSGYVLDVPPDGEIYLAAFPDFGDTEDNVTTAAMQEFETLSGRPITYAYFSDNWRTNVSFPRDAVETIASYGRVPFIRMMPRSVFWEEGPDPLYSLQAIIDGEYDTNLTRWAIDANNTGIPLIIEFGTEVNGEWFSWNGRWNGGGNTTEYGDPTYPDGPERFRDAYRHIVDLFRDLNVQNITWVFHVDDESLPEEDWNSMAMYYPGDEYVDWIGISVYGPLTWEDEWTPFETLMDIAYPALCNISSSKPLALLEFGADENGGLSNITTVESTTNTMPTTSTTVTAGVQPSLGTRTALIVGSSLLATAVVVVVFARKRR
ncbi:MAG: hypothetical protein DRO93_07490 [Candidatus Thorarchaeota archaeon]|nr:MAG: hypothetical protein DRO93_07490 [Candidatus Thorarchaeota archaeon]